MQPCTRCGTAIDPSTAHYSETGDLVCVACKSFEDVDSADHRAAMSFLGAAGGGMMVGIISICFNPIFLMSGLAIAGCAGTLLTLWRSPQYHERMGWRVAATYILALVGILAGCVRPALFVLVLLLGGGDSLGLF